jgi:hypothetical protein
VNIETLLCHLQGQGSTADADGWVSTAWDTAAKQLGDITLGSPAGHSMAGTVHGVWILPASVAINLATNQTVADAIAAQMLPAAAAPTVTLQVQTAAPVVRQAFSVAVSAAAAAGYKVRARVSFYGAAPRWGLCGSLVGGYMPSSIILVLATPCRLSCHIRAQSLCAAWCTVPSRQCKVVCIFGQVGPTAAQHTGVPSCVLLCRDCLLASCGTVSKNFSSEGNTLQGTATAYYPRAGRYAGKAVRNLSCSV